MYRRLWHGPARLAPQEVDRLTPAELALALDEVAEGAGPRPPAGAVPMGAHEVAEYAQRWRGQGLADRLRRARDG